MEYTALKLSLLLALSTALLLLPFGILAARWLSYGRVRWQPLILALIALPMVLPPTVLGYYLLTLFNPQTLIGEAWGRIYGSSLLFSFEGLLLASAIFNLPFMFQPIYLAFKSIPASVREAAWCCGLTSWQTLWRIELPLAWPGMVSALVLTMAHTLGEFGVVLMVGGNIPGETRTLSIAIYDKVQMFEQDSAGIMSAVLLGISFFAIGLIYILNDRVTRRMTP